MRSRRKLRFRLIVTFTLFGLGLSALFAFAAINIRERVEEQLINSALQDEADSLNAQVRANQAERPQFNIIQAATFSERTIYKAPLNWQSLDTGVHELYETGKDGKPRHFKVAVRREGGIINFLQFDVSRDELGKRQLITSVIAAVFLFGLFSLVLGVWLSARVLRPVTDLARRLRDFRRVGKAEALAPHFADDEVGELAVALDEYAMRLTSVVERDREFNSDVSHELRTPLAVIASTTELLQGSPDLTDKLRERLKRIERASRQATEMIEALLLLSRAERRGPTRGETTDVAKVASDVIESQRPQMGGKPIEIELVSDGSVSVNAPASVLSVALTNLIGNAIKYTMEGKVTVRVLDGRVDVIDTGPGIKPEDAEKLFQRGIRGESATGGGAGLGLAIVRRLCELYDWDVSLRPRADMAGAISTIDFR
nr:HAMP domain-containing sensor histidine kinase [Luteibacter rhizovicinus]